MNMSDDYRQIQEERDLIDRSLPALFPGKVRAPLPVCPDCAALAKQHTHCSKPLKCCQEMFIKATLNSLVWCLSRAFRDMENKNLNCAIDTSQRKVVMSK